MDVNNTSVPGQPQPQVVPAQTQTSTPVQTSQPSQTPAAINPGTQAAPASLPADSTQQTQTTTVSPEPVRVSEPRVDFYEQLFGGKISQPEPQAPPIADPRIDALSSKLDQLIQTRQPQAETIEPQAQPQPQQFNPQEFKTQVAGELFEVFDARQKVEAYASSVRAANPDLAVFEDEIRERAANILNSAIQNGTVRNYSDYVDASKAAINNAVGNFRQKLASARAAGKSDATIIREEVVASQAIAPQSQGSPVPSGNPQNVQPQTTSDYVMRRNQQHAGIRRMPNPMSNAMR